MDNLINNRKKKYKKIVLSGLAIFVLIIIVLIFAIYFPAKNVYSLAMAATQNGRLSYEYLKKQDIEKTSVEIKNTTDKLNKTKVAYKKLLWAKFIPFFGGYVADGERMLNASIYSSEASQIAVDSIKPYADVLGLKGQGSFVMGSAEERIQKAVKTLEKVIPNMDRVVEKMKLAQKEVEPIDPNRYNFKIKNIVLKDNILLVKNVLSEGVAFMEEAKPAIKILPKLLGEPNESRYIILFQNDKELRSTGGFLTAYAIFKIKSGKIEVEKSEDMYELDKRINSREKPPEMVLKYLKNIYYWNARDTNLSPDFKTSMDKFYSLYKKDDNREVTGIIALDTQFLVSILKIIGPVEVYGIKFTTDNEPKCNCPKVVYELERFATTQVDYVKEGRKDIIGRLMFEMMKKVLSSPPKQYWGPIFQTAIDMLNQKHMLIYLFDKQGQQGIEALNWAGRLKNTKSDYLHINDTNLDMFITRTVDQTIEVKKDKVIHDVSIKYNNPFPPSNCNLEQKEVLCLNSLYRSVTRLYAPKGSKLIENQTRGSEIKVKTYDDLGKTVFEAFFTMYPQHQATLEFAYEVPIAFDKEYVLLIQKQPGVEKVRYTVSINGKVQIVDLMKDEEIKTQL